MADGGTAVRAIAHGFARHVLGDEGWKSLYNWRNLTILGVVQPFLAIFSDVCTVAGTSFAQFPIWGVLLFFTLFLLFAGLVTIRPQQLRSRYVFPAVAFFLSAIVCGGVFVAQKAFAHGNSIAATHIPDVKEIQTTLMKRLGVIQNELEVVRQTTERTEKNTERTETKLDAESEDVKKILALVAREKGVEIPPLRAVLVKLGETGVADVNILKKLNDAADELIKLRAENDFLKKGPPQIAAIATEAQSLIDKGEFDAAKAVLARGRQAWKETRESSSRYEAQLLAQEAGIDHLQLAYRSAAAKYGEAADLVASFDAESRRKWLLAQASEFYAQGDEFGDNVALIESASLQRQCLALTSRESAPLDWAMTQISLGTALGTLGARESGTGKLTEAIAAYRAALEEYTRERIPLKWAMTQMNLGTALRTLGERESGTARLEDAVAAYRAALEKYTRERVPLDWARTQVGLGNALLTLGERESGTGKLTEAITAYRAALEEQTRERVPLDWAMTQMNLGNALGALGEREGGTGRLTEAIAAYREALKERTRERVPLQWAMTQNNLGTALETLGGREGGTGRLTEAVSAFSEALEEYTRERVPLDWARTQVGLGVALFRLGERESGTGKLTEAVAAYHAALEEQTRERVPLDWAGTQEALGVALFRLGERESGTGKLTEAVAAYRAALEEFTPQTDPTNYQLTMKNLGQVLTLLKKKSAKKSSVH